MMRATNAIRAKGLVYGFAFVTLIACTDTGIVGTTCDRNCVEGTSCASGLPGCGECVSALDCADRRRRQLCDPYQLTCVECTHSSDCDSDERCDEGDCLSLDDDDDNDEGDASD